MPIPRKGKIVLVPQVRSKGCRSWPDYGSNPLFTIILSETPHPTLESKNTFTIKLVLKIDIHIDNYKLPTLVAHILRRHP